MRSLITAFFGVVVASGSAHALSYSTPISLGQKTAEGVNYNLIYNDFDSRLGNLIKANFQIQGVYSNTVADYGAYSYDPAIFGAVTLDVGGDRETINAGGQAPYINDVASYSFQFGTFFDIPSGAFNASDGGSDSLSLSGGSPLRNLQGGDPEDNSTLRGFSGKIEYIYSDGTIPMNVPEPSSVVLLGAGLLALRLVQRHRTGKYCGVHARGF